MDIVWDQDKNNWLKTERDISFEEISEIILKQQYIDILENPTRPDQLYFILNLRNYTWVVPFLVDQNDNIVLKTAFMSRKDHKVYNDKNDESTFNS